MKTAYFDCFAGISGDMILGALIDLGLDLTVFREELQKLSISGYFVQTGKERRHNITGVKFDVEADEGHSYRGLRDITDLINSSRLSRRVKDLSSAVFEDIAVAEAKVHGCKVDDIHFHEVGAIDSIIDIVGVAIGLEYLGIEKVISTPVPAGSGWIKTSHGTVPIPAPATIEILKGVPVCPSPVKEEVVTPTGAAILKRVSDGFGGVPDMVVEAIGYGVGSKDFKEIPNLFRIVVGRTEETIDKVVVLETNVDDMDPQIFDYFMHRLLDAGAIDVFLVSVQMKKGRPGVLLKVLCNDANKDRFMDMIFEETTTLGIRVYPVDRYCLEREEEIVSTNYGQVSIKVSYRDGRRFNIKPEYEDCRRLAREKGVPLKKVMDDARVAYRIKTGWTEVYGRGESDRDTEE